MSINSSVTCSIGCIYLRTIFGCKIGFCTLVRNVFHCSPWLKKQKTKKQFNYFAEKQNNGRSFVKATKQATPSLLSYALVSIHLYKGCHKTTHVITPPFFIAYPKLFPQRLLAYHRNLFFSGWKFKKKERSK